MVKMHTLPTRQLVLHSHGIGEDEPRVAEGHVFEEAIEIAAD